MGGGCYTSSSFESYSRSMGKAYDVHTKRISGQKFDSTRLKEALNPKNKIRECCNSDEHPNTVPVILALDVTGSMGEACQETAEALSQIMDTLYTKFKDVEVMVMGVGDFECDDAPLQVSQFESDVRVAQQLDQIWMEKGGGGNKYESYTAPWLFGLYRTKLDAFDKQGRKGIIITMGDEPLNPDLPLNHVKYYLGKVDGEQLSAKDLKTKTLYENASKKFDIYHIGVKSRHNAYDRYRLDIKNSFGEILGQNLREATINELSTVICECIENSIAGSGVHLKEEEAPAKTDSEGAIVW